MSIKETPADVSAEIAQMALAWDLIAALMGGTAAMRQAGEKYLPKAPAESDDAYKYRRSVSTLYGAYRRTVETMASRPFSEPIQLGEDIPAGLLPYLEDTDLEGRDLQSFAHGVFQTALAYGLSHILVEFPRTPAVATLADEKAVGARPYLVNLDPRNIIGWRAERIAGVTTLTMLRLMEQITEAAGAWGTQTVSQVRVLERTRWSTYRQNGQKEWVFFEEGPVTIGVIPLATIYTGRDDFLTAVPPLLPLAYLNVEHWQSASDQQNILHVARVPILFASGFGADALKIGAGAAVTNDDPSAKLGYVEHSGAAIEAGRQSLLDLEERMGSLGAELLVSDPAAAAQTATKVATDVAEQTSALAAMVNNLEDSIAQALGFMARWAGLGDQGGTVELEGNYEAIDPLDVQSLVAAKEAGILSAETVFLEFQRLGMLDEDLTWEDEQARLATDRLIVQQMAITAVRDPLKHDDAVNHVDPSADPSAQPLQTGAGGAQAATRGAQAGGGAAASPAPDLAPLIAKFDALISALAKPAPEPAEQIDLSGLVDAIKAMPAPVVNVPAQKDDDGALVAAVLAMADAMKNGPAPQITVTAPNVTVEAPAAPTIVMPPINVTIEKSSGAVSFTEGPDGQITGAKLN